jgi:hypothetical protein
MYIPRVCFLKNVNNINSFETSGISAELLYINLFLCICLLYDLLSKTNILRNKTKILDHKPEFQITFNDSCYQNRIDQKYA